MRCAMTLAAAVLAVSGAAAGGQRADALFTIGTPDGLAVEFGLADRLWPDYLKVFPRPVVYTVGTSRVVDWPYLHPSSNDGWAGGRPHVFTIQFQAQAAPTQPLFLLLGLADAHPTEPSQVAVTVNDIALPVQRAPCGTGAAAQDPRAWAKPATIALAVPQGAVRQGRNAISIGLSGGSWVIYDYVMLTPDAAPPKLEEAPDTLLADALAGPMKGAEEIVFAVRQRGRDGHWYANFGYYAANDRHVLYGPGGRLCRLNLRTGELKVLLDDPQGGVRDPQVHYDGRTILFSYRKGGTPYYLLHEIQADGTGLRQLTAGPYDDIEPAYLPDGGIVFVSSRCNRWVNCWLSHVAVLYRCDADGGNIRPLSSNNEHDNTPWVLPDGRILYTRWEYVDRSQVHYHHLWFANPDGTGQMVYYGNQHGGTTMIDAKPIPGTQKIVASFSPGHGQNEHDGVVTIVDPASGPDARPFARAVSRGAHFRDPYAFTEDCLLVASRHEILLMNGRGQTAPVYSLPEADRKTGLECHEPRPLAPRPRERVIAPRAHPERLTGRLALVNVNLGRNMAGVQPGEIKKLLVLETLPKPINFTGGMEPLSYGGTFTLERVLGTVPVEPDGSAYMELPALRSLFFVALDANDLSVKRMQSFLTVMPGETTSCVGCHENRTEAPPPANLLALRRPPSPIEPIAGVPDVLDFPRDVQPILDRHCTKCHGYERTEAGGPRSGGVILTGDRGPMFSHSYFTLSALQQFADGRNRPQSNYPPRTLGSSASPLMKKILAKHHGAQLSPHEQKIVRLWIETGAPYPGTYAALGTGMIGGYAQNSLDRSDTRWPSMKAAAAVLAQRCAGCHQGSLALPSSPSDNMGMPPWEIHYGSPKLRFSRHILYNLSRPEKSLLLLAPLAANAGGYGLCKDPAKADELTGAALAVFANAQDADYQKLLTAIREAKAHLETIKRFDMPGFVPHPAWVREMKRYGVLPNDLPAEAPLDPYVVEQAYWKSLWHRPPPTQAKPQ
ncbi:MAG TPA: polysaccharide lyase family protein [Planctomycetota bacterium]|nr:polysaccharide lyase family protein [Planctomycetota bacterium]HRR82609.1 polysaccharide lyase family protein [Planctomycetota bacterium]HRT94797.1 polysaccharide lyase family protein [Planctomycetota bacterium]